MRDATVVRPSAHHAKPLVLRGGLARTFGGVVSFLAVLFLCPGLYLLGDALVHPLNAGSVTVLAGALSVTLGAILLFYLLKPLCGLRRRSDRFQA